VNVLSQLPITGWNEPAAGAAESLESGKVLFAPRLPFELADAERRFLSPDCLDGKSKNVSYRPESQALQGTSYKGADRDGLLAMVRRYHNSAVGLMDALCPEYRGKLKAGFTSYRPAEIAGRSTSWRKDDTRLHVDAFPSRPLRGLRILRVFSNVNPEKPRLWRVGEQFEDVAKTFLPAVRPAWAGSSWLLAQLHVTKGMRSPYDHLMLGIHDGMKADEVYQAQSAQVALEIPPDATWACFTDSVSHAAMGGQFAFEQTFYLPVDSMKDPARSPLKVLERLTGRGLI
jgi:hypothetical protein